MPGTSTATAVRRLHRAEPVVTPTRTAGTRTMSGARVDPLDGQVDRDAWRSPPATPHRAPTDQRAARRSSRGSVGDTIASPAPRATPKDGTLPPVSCQWSSRSCTARQSTPATCTRARRSRRRSGSFVRRRTTSTVAPALIPHRDRFGRPLGDDLRRHLPADQHADTRFRPPGATLALGSTTAYGSVQHDRHRRRASSRSARPTRPSVVSPTSSPVGPTAARRPTTSSCPVTPRSRPRSHH